MNNQDSHCRRGTDGEQVNRKNALFEGGADPRGDGAAMGY